MLRTSGQRHFGLELIPRSGEFWRTGQFTQFARAAFDLLFRARFRFREVRDGLEALIAAQPFRDRVRRACLEGDALFEASALCGAPEPDHWALRFTAHRDPALSFGLRLETDNLAELAELLRSLYWDHSGEVASALTGLVPAPLLAKLIDDVRAGQTFPTPLPEVGVYRGPHASLVLCSGATTLLLDPVPLATGLPGLDTAPMLGLVPDAVLITHLHADHWSLPSVLHYCDPDAPVIVPHVPQPSLLCPEIPALSLRACGQAVVAPAWGDSLSVGDFDVTVLPFYGEQPSVEPPAVAAPIRNWGNCYHIQCDAFSVVLLVDSGRDPGGDMVPVVTQQLTDEPRGSLILACMRSFPCPFFGGLENYWVTLPLARLEELWQQYEAGCLPSVTAGPAGIAALLAGCESTYFAPYAHGFSGFGQPVDDIGWISNEGSERAAMERLTQLGVARSRLRPWNVGDRMVFGDTPAVETGASARGLVTGG
ncbi:MBL fold metallo-hydrolase [Haliangium ochraceum]|uniref:Metallo-beta-lactamase superfamily protein n=1 Tax=Haliangium ochraceum (strain DSM 14365 / JCM 11303 / SMP-2) TaxID=502025 RepID=D0LSA8_HALO1|nr:MBL fold metallo-hydrolase [Haliangium ochraceum]ACY15607.1 metallo-beta-lactamase superfamily protein [Haliangium ochraceum DSM 14365]